MKPKVKHIVKSQMEAGVTPTPKDVDLAHGLETYNEIGAGINVSYEDLSYIDLKLVQLIESVKNDVRQKKIEEAQKDAGGY